MPTKESIKAVAEMLADVPDGVNEPNAIETTALTPENLADPVTETVETAETPAVKAEDKKTEEPPKVEAEALDEGLAAFAKRAKELFDQGGMAAVLDQLYSEASGDDQRAFIESLTKSVKQNAPVVDLAKDYEPQSAFETALMPIVDEIKALPQLKRDVQGAFGQHADVINEARLYNEIAKAQVHALGEVLGISFDAPDLAAMKKAIAAGKTYEDAAKAYSTKKVIEAGKQALKLRPNTPSASASDSAEPYKPGTSMVQMLQRERANGNL